MNRTQRFVRGFSIGYAQLVLTTLAGLWLTPFFLHALGQDGYGLWLVGTQVLAYLLLLDFGVIALLPREVAYATGRALTGTPETHLRQLTEDAFGLALAQTPLVALAAFATLLWLPATWTPLRWPLTIVLAVLVATFPFRSYHAILVGLQDLAFAARVQLVAWMVGTALAVGLVWRGVGLSALAAGWCATQVISIGVCAWRLRTAHGHAMPWRPALRMARAKSYLGSSLWVSLGQIAQALLNGADLLIVGALLGPRAVVPFACTGKLLDVLANQPQGMLQAAQPALSELRSSAAAPRLFDVSSALAQATMALSGLIACVVLAIDPGFVGWWVGPDQFAGFRVMVLLVVEMLVRHLNTTHVYALFCFGHERRLAVTAIVDGVVSVAVGALLIRWIGLAGAPLGSIVGATLVSLPANTLAFARDTQSPPGRFLSMLAPWAVRLAAAAAACVAGGVWFRGASFPVLALIGASAVTLYLSMAAPAVMRSRAGVYLQPYLAPLLNRWPVPGVRSG